MTSNQRRAAQLAEHILKGRTQGSALSDHDWHLLLLAGGVNKCAAPALVVAGKVMEHARRQSGYFAPASVQRQRLVKVALGVGAGAFSRGNWRARGAVFATSADVPATHHRLGAARP